MDSPRFSMERRDFWKLGPVWVWKWLVLGAVLAGSLAVVAAFGLPFSLPAGDVPAYRCDDPALASISGVVRVLDETGAVRYRGEVDGGNFTGKGQVFDGKGRLVYDGPLVDGVREGPGAKVYQDGALVYEGEMARDVYEGEGCRTDPEEGTISQGQFANGRLEGQGEVRSASGVLLREGTFSADALNGPGKEYSAQGVLLREGAFEKGLLNGAGAQYDQGGGLLYEGEFQRGAYHGQGALYDPSRGAVVYEGEFADGKPSGAGRLYHPSGQLLYEGEVKDAQPRAEAFLGLSLSEVEAAFSQHWQLYYAQDGSAAFVYPDFQLMFWTPGPVKLTSPTLREAQTKRERQELLAALSDAKRETEEVEDGAEETAPAIQTMPVEVESEPALDLALDPDTDKNELVIQAVLSYGRSLPGVVQGEGETWEERAPLGWRERFSDFASGWDAAAAAKAGPFVYEFPAWPTADALTRCVAAGDGVETVTAYRQDKEGSVWYQSAARRETP